MRLFQVRLLHKGPGTDTKYAVVESANTPGEIAVDVDSPLFHFAGYLKYALCNPASRMQVKMGPCLYKYPAPQ
jgi:hypothetical protein